MGKDVAAVSCSGYDYGDGRIDLLFVLSCRASVQACNRKLATTLQLTTCTRYRWQAKMIMTFITIAPKSHATFKNMSRLFS